MTSLHSRIVVIPVECRKESSRFPLARTILRELARTEESLRDGDILVVSSKFVSMAEGRYVELDDIKPERKARRLSRLYQIDPRLAQLVMEESEEILGGIPGFILAVTKGVLAPNAGIDRSNVPPGKAILYPLDPDGSARDLRAKLLRSANPRSMRRKNSVLRRLGVILSDSRVTPTRVGTIGVAVGVAGVSPIEDLRGSKDLFGNELKVTIRAVADQLCSAAELVMGESDDSIPVVIIRGAAPFTSLGESVQTSSIMKIEANRCLFVQGLRSPPSREKMSEKYS